MHLSNVSNINYRLHGLSSGVNKMARQVSMLFIVRKSNAVNYQRGNPDEWVHVYKCNTNQLSHINDNISNNVVEYDIDNQQLNNYRYDKCGNMLLDLQEKINL
ncbi:MAG: hypothetical protein N3A01_06925, partial [Bacteroidales bacterium]|nr:hypothetical protein [Bacteroidales bacterium]